MFTSIFINNVEVVVYRDDLNHPTVSGNKLHKLKPNIALAKEHACNSIVSFGGPYSNHLHALAWACKEAGLSSIGVVRGELHASLTPTLKDCQAWGMQLVASPRTMYRDCLNLISSNDRPCLAANPVIKPILTELLGLQGLLPIEYESTLVVPEGGSNTLAIQSLTDAYQSVFKKLSGQGISHGVCATGTGATLTGLYKASPDSVEVMGVQAVAEGDATLERIHTWLGLTENTPTRLSIQEGHLGRFAKAPPELVSFIKYMETKYNIPLDPVYTGKVMFKLVKMIEAGYFKSSDKILFIHTGGLQGKRT